MSPKLPLDLLPMICQELLDAQSGRTLVNLTLTCRAFAAVVHLFLSQIQYNISNWNPKQVLPNSPLRPISFSSAVSHTQVEVVLRILNTSRPLFGILEESNPLTICPLAVASSQVPARYLAHYIAAFAHPKRILIKTSLTKVDEAGRQKLVWLVRDLRRICRDTLKDRPPK